MKAVRAGQGCSRERARPESACAHFLISLVLVAAEQLQSMLSSYGRHSLPPAFQPDRNSFQVCLYIFSLYFSLSLNIYQLIFLAVLPVLDPGRSQPTRPLLPPLQPLLLGLGRSSLHPPPASSLAWYVYYLSLYFFSLYFFQLFSSSRRPGRSGAIVSSGCLCLLSELS